VPTSAGFGTFLDQAVDDNANGLTDRIVVTVPVNVQIAGQYRFALELKGSNGKLLEGRSNLALATGAQQVSASFDVMDIIRELGVDGPYQRVNAILARQTATPHCSIGRPESGDEPDLHDLFPRQRHIFI